MKLPMVSLTLAIVASATAADLKESDVSGKRWALVDQRRIEVYRLGEDGVVLAQFGSKDGPVTGPVFSWKIDQGFLVIETGKSVHEKFTLVEKKDDLVTVRRQNGELAIFQISTLKK
jgi:hypothetical protein